MPLTNNVIVKLNEITTIVENKEALQQGELEEIKKIFKELLQSGERYDSEEIESWFENEGSWKNKDVRVRLANLSHYVQSKHEQLDRFRVISDNPDSCGCGN